MRPSLHLSRLLLLFTCIALLPAMASATPASRIAASTTAYLPIVSSYGAMLPIRDLTFTYTSEPAVVIWGEMINVTSQRIYYPTVSAVAGLKQGYPVFVSTGQIDPGGLVAFRVTIAGVTPSIPINVTSRFTPVQDVTNPASFKVRWLSVKSSELHAAPTPKITGILKNENPETLIWCGAVAVLYDADDHVIGMVDVQTAKPPIHIEEGPGLVFAAQEEIAFWADIPPELQVARYRIQGSGTANP